MDRKDATAIILDMDEQELRTTLLAVVYFVFSKGSLTKETLIDIFDHQI